MGDWLSMGPGMRLKKIEGRLAFGRFSYQIDGLGKENSFFGNQTLGKRKISV